jgi:hypothetical protein
MDFPVAKETNLGDKLLDFVDVGGFCKIRFLMRSKNADSFCCLGRRELGDSLGSLADGMLGEFTREHKTYCSLDLSAGPVHRNELIS